MPGPNFVLDKGYVPTAAVGQFKVVKAASTKEKCTEATAGDKPLGVCQNTISSDDATAGRPAAIRVQGISRCVAGGVIAIDDDVKVTTGGKVIATTTANDLKVGRATTAAAADGDWVDVILQIGAKV